MAIIKKFSPFQNLSSFQVFLNDTERTSQYFKITEFEDTLTGGKNGFLIEGSEYLKETTEVKVELLDVENNPIYFEPGDGIPEYYEGISKLISVHVYDDTPIGTGKITILGELKNYIDENGAVVPVPDEWKGIYNVKWERTFQVNKNLNNETIVRFYKRPIVSITELVKPIFSKSIPTVTDTGYAHGISETPIDGTDIRNWRAGTLYRLRRTNGTWDRDVDENTITFTSPSFTADIVEVLNDTDVLVNVPYTVNNLVSNFTSGSYSVSYADFQNEVVGESTLTGSFAKIDITQLKTFVGDVARVKVFRKSRNSVGDFQFVQESKLESTELLRDVTTPSNTEIPYGRFDETNLSTYWITSSDDHEVSIDSSVLSQAVKFDYDSVQGGVQRLITSQSFSISKDVEYTLNFRTLLSGSLDDSGKSVRAFFSSSNFTQDFLTASGSAIYRTRQNISQNILSENTGDAHLVFEVKGDDWYVSNVSLKNAQDTSFSPDEFTLIQDIPRKLVSETFDFRFEFYDINNNYIPVDVTAVGVFDGGNDFPTSGKLLTFESDRNAFRFTSGSIGSPPFQQLQFKVTQNNLTGSVSFASSAFDEDGNYIDPSSYSGTYPGTLTSVTPAGAILRIADFSGSDESVIVGSIVYTASLEGLEEFETVYRLEDGDNAPTLLVTSNANQFTYEPTSLTPKPVGQTITVRAQRKNLASLVTPITVNSGSNRPALTYVDTVGGIDTYTISATEFSSSFSANSFDEVTYQFTGSDVFGIEQTDEITLSKVVNFDGVSITLSNESTSFRSNGQGLILDSFDSGDGEVEVRIADKEIDHSNGLSSPNTFDIVSATATNVTEAYSSYLTNEYGISAMSADSGSLVLNISYLAGDNSTTQSFQKKVNYNKNRIAQPSIIIDTTNKTQNVDAKSTGVQITPFEDSTITVREFYTGSVTTFSSSDVTISFDSNPSTITTDNGNLTLSFNDLADATNSAQVQFTATVTDSEGTSRSVSDSISLSKSVKSAPNVEIQAYPSAQSIQADSNGSGSNSPVDLSLEVNEGGASRTITGIGTIVKTGGLNVTTPSSPFTTISFSTDASDMTSDTGTLTIPVQTTNSEGTSIEKDVVVTVTRVRKAVPSVIVSADIPSQVVTANSAGTQTGTLSNVSVSALEGGTSVFDSMTVAGSSGFDSTPTVSSSTLQLSSRTLTSDSGLVTLTVNYTDSEGNENSQSLVINASKVEQPAGAVTIELNPPNQAVPIDIQDTITAPSTFLVQVFDSEGSFTHSSTLASDATFKITNLSQTNTSGTPANSNGTITPATPSNANGSNVTFDVTYKGRDGLTSDAISKTHSVRVISEGSTGPGIVFTGPWDTNRIYQYDISNGRRDAVLYNGRYFATLQTTTTSTAAPTTGGDSYWEDLGTDSFFVAGEIAIFTNSYVQEVLNIGTTSNTLSAANITLNGSDAYPYFSLGQSAAVGTQEFGANGIFIGRHDVNKNTDASNGAYVMSISNGTNYMKWDGSTLDIKGQLTISGESSPLDVDEITNSSDPMGGGTLNYNPNMTIVAKDGRPDGVKSVYHSNVASNISYQNTDKSILKVYSSSDTTIGAGFPAIKLNKDAKYIIHFRVKTTSSNVSSGFYFRMQEYDGELPQDITHICNNASSGESGVVEDTRQITQGSKLVVNTPSGGDIDNGGITTSFVDYIVTYTPTSTAKWVSPIFLNWSGMGTRELHVDRLAIMVDTSDKDQGTVGGWTITSTEIQGGTISGGGDGSFTTQGMRLGSTGYISAPQFYIDSSGNAKFAGSLTVGGTDTAVSTVVSGAAAGANAIPSGQAASDITSNNTTITGGNISTGNIQSTGYSAPSNITNGSDFSTSGMNINLDNGSVTAPRFRINTSGDAFFSGIISGSSVEGGNIIGAEINVPNASNPNFTVTEDGNMVAQNATISGSISVQQGSIGEWVVDPISQGGSLRNEDSNNPGEGTLVFEPSRPEIVGRADTGQNGALEKKLSIHPENSWANISGGNTFVSGVPNNNSNNPWTMPSNVTSGNNNNVAYTEQEQSLPTSYYRGGSVSNIAVPTDGTFEVSGLYNLSAITIPKPSTITLNPTYPNYSPTNPYETHGGNFSAIKRYFEVWIRFTNTSTNVDTDVLVQQITSEGDVIVKYYQAQGTYPNLYWSLQQYTQTGNEYNNTGFQSTTTQATLTSGNYTARYLIKKGAKSGYTQPELSNGSPGTPSYTTVSNTISQSDVGYNSTSFTVVIPSNLVELSSKGLQILSDSTSYVQIFRNTTITNFTEAMRIQGAKLKVVGSDTVNPITANALEVNGGKSQLTNGAYIGGWQGNSPTYSAEGYLQIGSNAREGNILGTATFNSTIMPGQRYLGSTNGYWNTGNSNKNIGSSTNWWNTVYRDSESNPSDIRLKENISGSVLGLDFINELRPVQYNMKDSVKKRTRYGLIAQEVSESLSSVGLTTQNFKGLSTGSEEDQRLENEIGKPFDEILSSGSYYLYHNDTASALINEEWWEETQENAVWNLDYSEFISPMIKAIQELSTKVTQLENQISGSL